MPIKPIVLQRRHAELGRIRLGHRASTQSGGTRPAKLAAFRFTSPSERYIRDLATLYGGEPRPWDNNGVPEFEVFTEAKSMPVIVVKGGLSQWMETWSGGGCVHRCDGETNVLTNQPCNPDDPAHKDAKPTTRLSMMLPELEAIGAWRMETKGWNAAAEIPAVAELALFVGDLVPAHLNLVERRAVKDGKTSRFVVPVLDLQIGTQRLREIVAEKSGTAPELEAPAGTGVRPALEGGSAGAPVVDAFTPFFEQLAQASTFDEVQAAWSAAKKANLVGERSEATDRRGEFFEAVKAKGEQLQAAGQQPTNAERPAAAPPEPRENPDGTFDAEVVDDGDADAVWQQILLEAGKQGMTTPDVEDDFAQKMGGLTAGEASASELQHYLGLLRGGQAAVA